VWVGQTGPLHYIVENLSADGALLTAGPLLAMGEQVELTLYLANRAPMEVHAHVVRRADQRVGVVFSHLRAEDEDAIQGAVLDALEAYQGREAQSRHVLVASQSRQVCDTLERELRVLGHQVVSATTLLEAITRVQDPFAHFDVALVDLDLTGEGGRDLVVYLAEEHPQTYRVLLSGDVARYKLQLASLTIHVDAILPKPWDQRTLAAAMPR
jgi:CheY-like chemotaxis protein